MSGLALADLVAVQLGSVPERSVFVGGVPDGDLPARYLVVWASEGSEGASRLCGRTNWQSPSVWVTSVSRNPDGMLAAREAQWGAGGARVLLRDWSPPGLQWLIEPTSSQPARRNEQAANQTIFYAVEQFACRITI